MLNRRVALNGAQSFERAVVTEQDGSVGGVRSGSLGNLSGWV